MGKPNLKEDVHKMLSQSGYSERAIKYFQEAENIGSIEEANQVTELTGDCGHRVTSRHARTGTVGDVCADEFDIEGQYVQQIDILCRRRPVVGNGNLVVHPFASKYIGRARLDNSQICLCINHGIH